MEFRPHGANPEKLYKLFGIQMPAHVVDFSTNTNAVRSDSAFTPDLRAALEDYPDDDVAAVRSLVSQKTGAPLQNILVTSGANEAIYILASLVANRENAILEPVYGEYLRALKAYGARVRNIFTFDRETLPDRSAVWLCNPCNPTGKLIPDAVIEGTAAKLPRTLFIVDEAYRDFVWTQEMPRAYRNTRNIIRLRSLTKTYNLCGARIAYLLADERVTKKIRNRTPSWNVNNLAQQAALFYLADKTLLQRTKDYYAAEIPRLTRALSAAGYETMPTCVNFFLVKIADDENFIRYMLRRGIVVRHTRNFPSLDGRYVRIAARTREENDLLISAMRAYARDI